MITLLASIAGFASSIVPEIFKFFLDRNEKRHELDMIDRHITLGEKKIRYRLKAISDYADVEESKALYKTFYSKVRIIDALNASVRPVLAYAFFILYSTVKYYQFQAMYHVYDYNMVIQNIWTEDDRAIFAGIISFYFGQRAISKILSIKKGKL